MMVLVVNGSTLLLFIGASLALLALPGPAVIYVITRSIDQGQLAGAVSVAGIETGTFVYAVAAAVGLTGLIAASEVGFAVIKFAGAGYLIFLGLQKLRDRGAPEDPLPKARSSRLFLDGLLVQLLNPKIAIFFLAFLPQFVDQSSPSVTAQIMVLGVVFTALATLSDGLYVLLAGSLSAWLRGARARLRLSRISGVVYIGLGITAAVTGRRPAHA
jgi:threonine/homoserine/homoserine lactone efflux protein